MSYDWLSIISLILWLIVPIIVFVARHWIIAVVSRGVQHQFDREIEQLRTELRKAEEEHRSQLRSKEADIAALRNVVLTGSAGRQALLDKRRLEAVEKVWTAVNDLGQLKGLSSTMAILNYSAFAKEASNPRAQQLLSVIGKTAPADLKELKNVARDERPFLTESAWAYFHAYRMILYMTLVRYHFLKSFVTPGEDPEKYFSVAALRNILKAAHTRANSSTGTMRVRSITFWMNWRPTFWGNFGKYWMGKTLTK